MATLRVVSTLARELEGRSFALGPEGTSLGRDGANRVVIPEASVSRRHARIEAAGTAYHLVDQRSSNGTFVNGEPTTMHRLSDGDTVRIGRTTFVFEAGGGAGVAPGVPPPGPRCATCGAEAPAGSRFCAGCGEPLPASPGSTVPTPQPGSRGPTAPEIPLMRGDEAADRGAGSEPGASGPGASDPTSPPSQPSWPPGSATAPPAAAAALAAAPEEASPRARRNWAIGCALIALLLLATAAGGLLLLHREGRIDLPGLPDVEAPTD